MAAPLAAATGALTPSASATSEPPVLPHPAFQLPAVVAAQAWLARHTAAASTTATAAAPAWPAVTLTWAQAVDGTMAARVGAPTVISGADSLAMTHALRVLHDAICVGVGTVAADNPRLNARIVGGRPPRPVVLDPSLRMPLTVKLLTDATCVKPVVYAVAGSEGVAERAAPLRAAGATVVLLPAAAGGGLHVLAVLAHLRAELGLASVMVEGGPATLRAFFRALSLPPASPPAAAAAEGAAPHDLRVPAARVIITIAPAVLLGGVGLLTRTGDDDAPPLDARLTDTSMTAVGGDFVLSGTLPCCLDVVDSSAAS